MDDYDLITPDDFGTLHRSERRHLETHSANDGLKALAVPIFLDMIFERLRKSEIASVAIPRKPLGTFGAPSQ
jgi:hypothetical protein